MKVEMLNLNGGLFQAVCINNNLVEITKVVWFGEVERYSTQDQMIVELFKHVSAGLESKQKEIRQLEDKLASILGVIEE